MGVIDVLDNQLRSSAAEGVRELSSEEAAREIAFHRLVDAHLDRAYRLAAVVLHDPSEAQDAVHDAFLTAWRKFDSLHDRSRLEAWFDRIVVNTCRDRLRHTRRLQVRDISAEHDCVVDDGTIGVPDELVIRRALCRLKPDDRIVLALRFYRDMKVDDIAAAMGIRPRAATSRLHRALERLRHVLDEDALEVAR
jgi:RNA polymerase sigma-70 factor (ECF subfamily)